MIPTDSGTATPIFDATDTTGTAPWMSGWRATVFLCSAPPDPPLYDLRIREDENGHISPAVSALKTQTPRTIGRPTGKPARISLRRCPHARMRGRR